jgi:hypothetical protein
MTPASDLEGTAQVKEALVDELEARHRTFRCGTRRPTGSNRLSRATRWPRPTGIAPGASA